MKTFQFRIFLGILLPLAVVAQAQAGVFNIPRFIQPKQFAIGIEPELTFGNQSGIATQLRGGYGLSETNNLAVIAGVGTGTRLFRLGGAFTFDFFPDTDGQPGIGLALQGLYIGLPNTGSVELTAIPYIHKSFKSDYGAFDPFLAFPVGLSLSGGTYQPLLTLALGTQFQHSDHFSTVVELGVGLSNVSTYFSGGLIYYP
jgi:hypothetical protein